MMDVNRKHLELGQSMCVGTNICSVRVGRSDFPRTLRSVLLDSLIDNMNKNIRENVRDMLEDTISESLYAMIDHYLISRDNVLFLTGSIFERGNRMMELGNPLHTKISDDLFYCEIMLFVFPKPLKKFDFYVFLTGRITALDNHSSIRFASVEAFRVFQVMINDRVR